MEKKEIEKKVECNDKRCPFHGQLSIRGRYFEGYVKKIVGSRAVIEFERFVYYRKYERFARAYSRLHAHIPKCLAEKIRVGDLVKVGECRPLSKIIHFVVVEKIK